MIPQLKKAERGEAHGRMKEQREEDYQDYQPSSFDQVAGQAARQAIRRLKLEDNTRSWATLKAIIIEAIQLSRQA